MINHEMQFPKAKKSINDNPFEKPRLIYVYGAKGSGKTTLVVNLLMLLEKEDFEEGDQLMVSGNGRDPLLKALNFKITDKPEELNNFMLMVKNNTDKDKKYLLILDDIMSHPEFKIMSGRSEFLNFVLSSRHYNCYIIVTAQAWSNSFSPTLKGNVDLFFIYQPKNKKESDAIINFFDDSSDVKKALQLLKLTNDKNEKEGKPRTFLYINNTQPKTRFFLGFKDQLKDL